MLNLEEMPKNPTILKTFATMYNKLNSPKFPNIAVAVSGGSDSDIILDMTQKCLRNQNTNKIRYVFYDTKIELQATHEHLKFLEKKYNIDITRIQTDGIPKTIKEYGSPFWAKHTSQLINQMQKKNFDYTNKTSLELTKKYYRSQTWIKYWNNENSVDPKQSMFNIGYYSYLKDFLIQNNPTFSISDLCCTYTKKLPSKNYIQDNNIDLMVVGVRKQEGGIRRLAYKNTCYDEKETYANYRPLFFWSDNDKKEYNNYYNIQNSKCYTEYGLTRTGCVGCPFNKEYENDLLKIEKYEPKLVKASRSIFKESHEYTKAFETFRLNQKK